MLAVVCSTVLDMVESDGFLASINAVESSAACMSALAELARL